MNNFQTASYVTATPMTSRRRCCGLDTNLWSTVILHVWSKIFAFRLQIHYVTTSLTSRRRYCNLFFF